MKKATVFTLLFFLCLGAWTQFIYTNATAEARFSRNLQEAERLFEKGILDEALAAYLKCQDLEPENKEVLFQIALLYQKAEEQEKARQFCSKLEKLGENSESLYLLWAETFSAERKYAEAAKILQKGRGEKIEEKKREIDGKYYLKYVPATAWQEWTRAGPQEVATVMGAQRTAAVYTASGRRLFTGNFSWIGGPSEDGTLYPVCEDGQFLFSDENGNRRLVPEQGLFALGPLSSGYAPMATEEGFGFADPGFQPWLQGFEKTYTFQEGLALVRRDAEYSIIDTAGQTVKTLFLSNVVENPYGYSFTEGIFIGISGESYAVYQADGTPLMDFTAEEIRLPAEKGGWLAFRQGSLWGFADWTGKVQIQPTFTDAKSFSEGYAAVKKGEKWGYINLAGAWVIPPTFEDAGTVSREGTAFVKTAGGVNLLKLYKYE